jgi:hypothetical protein
MLTWVRTGGLIVKNRKAIIISMRNGGRGEIRTHEGAKPPAGFQDRCLKPLGHPSIIVISKRYTIRQQNKYRKLAPNWHPKR